MHDFHYKTSEKLRNKIMMVCKICKCKGAGKMLRFLFDYKERKIVEFIDAVIEKNLLKEIEDDFIVNEHVMIYDSIYDEIKLYHKLYNTFSIATIFRKILNFICDIIIGNGVDYWFEFLAELISDFRKKSRKKTKKNIKYDNNWKSIHMYTGDEMRHKKIIFFSYSGTFLDQLRI